MAKKVGPYRPYLLPSATQAQTYCGASKKWSGKRDIGACLGTSSRSPHALHRTVEHAYALHRPRLHHNTQQVERLLRPGQKVRIARTVAYVKLP